MQKGEEKAHLVKSVLCYFCWEEMDFTEILHPPSQWGICSLHSAAAVQETLLRPTRR